MATLTAGVGRANITPPVGLQSEGYILRVEPLMGIESQLYATALVLADERAKVAILDCDIIGLSLDTADVLRDRIAAAIGTERSHVLLAWSHTHNGPKMRMTGMAGARSAHQLEANLSPEAMALHDAYAANFANLVVSAAVQADAARRPARAGAGRGTAPVAVQRRERLPDGTIILGQDPAGPTDHEVGVVRVDSLDGAPIAALVNYAAHPVVLGPEPLRFDADYPGVVREVVEAATGATCLFLMGAAGDQMPIQAWGTDPAVTRRLGRVLGHEAARVWFGVETRRTEVVKRHVKSLAELLVYDVVEVPGATHQVLAAAETRVQLPRAPLPPLAEAERTYEAMRADHARVTGAPAPDPRLVHLATIELNWSRAVLDAVRAGRHLPPVEGVVQAIRLNDVGLATSPGEAFVQLGLDVKARSPLVSTLYASYCNSSVGYLPTPDAYPRPGQRVLTPDNVYYKGSLLTPLAPECAGIVTEAGLALLRRLTE